MYRVFLKYGAFLGAVALFDLVLYGLSCFSLDCSSDEPLLLIPAVVCFVPCALARIHWVLAVFALPWTYLWLFVIHALDNLHKPFWRRFFVGFMLSNYAAAGSSIFLCELHENSAGCYWPVTVVLWIAAYLVGQAGLWTVFVSRIRSDLEYERSLRLSLPSELSESQT